MKTNLPESRNRNLPPPPAHAAPVESRRRMMPAADPDEANRGPSPLRSFIAMLVVGGLLAAGIFFYMRGSKADLAVREQVFSSLEMIGKDIWNTGSSMALGVNPEDEDARLDLEDLPRIIAALRGASRGVPPKILPLEGDPPPGNEKASHQILFSYDQKVVLVIRVNYDHKTGSFTFIGVANRIVPSRKVLLESKPPETPAPQPPPAETTPAPAPPPAPAGSSGEKVSEPPANPQ